MNCKNCGAVLLEDSKFCTACGTPVTEEVAPVVETPAAPTVEAPAAPVAEAKPAKKAKKKGGAACALGVLIGLVCIIAGLITMFSASSSLSYASFGGDFYTYTYRGIRAVEKMMVLNVRLGGGLLAAFGAFMSCYFLNRRAERKAG